MLKLLLRLFDFNPPPLEEYDIPTREARTRLEQKRQKTGVDEQGFKGAWKDSQHYEAVNMNLKKDEGAALDGWDIAALTEKLGARWKSTPAQEAKAIEIKRAWLVGKSAQQISKEHRNQTGWGDRTVDDYISAYNLAKREREGENG